MHEPFVLLFARLPDRDQKEMIEIFSLGEKAVKAECRQRANLFLNCDGFTHFVRGITKLKEGVTEVLMNDLLVVYGPME